MTCNCAVTVSIAGSGSASHSITVLMVGCSDQAAVKNRPPSSSPAAFEK
jgi:hypothetical protein